MGKIKGQPPLPPPPGPPPYQQPSQSRAFSPNFILSTWLMTLKLPFLYSTWNMNKGETNFSVFQFVSAVFTFSHFFVAIFVDGTIITFRSIKYEHAWQDA